MAILNDSTGTLMSCAHKNHDCKIGIIVGKTKIFLRNSKNLFNIYFGCRLICIEYIVFL